MSIKDETRREMLANRSQMEQQFKEIKNEAYEPQIERLGQTNKEQNLRSKK